MMKKNVLVLIAAGMLLGGCGPNDPGRAKDMSITQNQRASIENRITPYSVVAVSGDAQVSTMPILPGELKYASCGACHGSNGGGGVGPALAGQTVEYIIGRLMQYKAGEKVGSQSNLMWANAGNLTDQDMQDLAEYIVTL